MSPSPTPPFRLAPSRGDLRLQLGTRQSLRRNSCALIATTSACWHDAGSDKRHAGGGEYVGTWFKKNDAGGLIAISRSFAEPARANCLHCCDRFLVHCLRHAVEEKTSRPKSGMMRPRSRDGPSQQGNLDDSMAVCRTSVGRRCAHAQPSHSRRELARNFPINLPTQTDHRGRNRVPQLARTSRFDEIAERMEIKSGAARMLWMATIAKFKGGL